MIKVLLTDIADDLTLQGDGMEMFLNLETGKTFYVTPDIADYVNEENCNVNLLADWEKEEVEKVKAIFSTGKYISLPSKYDLDEWQIMEDFCQSVKNPTQQHTLITAVSGKGAFHRFRSSVEKMGLLQDWYDFKTVAIIEMARIWCEKHHIPYEESRQKAQKQQKYDLETEGIALALQDGQTVYILQNAAQERAIWSDFRQRLYGDTDPKILETELENFEYSSWMNAFLIWTAAEQPIGFLELSERNIVDGCPTSPVAYIEGIYVVEAFRSKGLGQQLINFCKNWARENGMTELATDSSLHDVTAQKFHKRMGFQETERIVQFKMKV